MRYLPDFFLPNSRGGGGIYVEVKGDKNALKNNWEHHAQMHDWGGVLPDFQDSKGKSDAGLLLLSDIPEASESKIYFHPILQHDQGLVKSFAFFAGNRLSVIENSPLAEILSIDPIYGLDCSGQNWDIEMRQVHTNRYYTNVVKAYAAARAARFEHGQQGIT
jgi:hypothetical protein